jgi:hypothetical protein
VMAIVRKAVEEGDERRRHAFGDVFTT